VGGGWDGWVWGVDEWVGMGGCVGLLSGWVCGVVEWVGVGVCMFNGNRATILILPVSLLLQFSAASSIAVCELS